MNVGRQPNECLVPNHVLEKKEARMKARTQIDPGICKFTVVVSAESEDSQNVTFEFVEKPEHTVVCS